MERWKSWLGKAVAVALLATLALGTRPMAWALAADQAADESAGQSVDINRYWEGAARKFGRGVVNTSTGWLEVFKQPVLGAQERGVEGGVLGFFTGIGMTVARTVVGVYDTASFLVPVPEHFEPVMRPELVFEGR